MTARRVEPDPPHLRPSRFSYLVLQTPRFREMTTWYKTWPVGGGHGPLSRRPVEQVAFADRFGEALFPSPSDPEVPA